MKRVAIVVGLLSFTACRDRPAKATPEQLAHQRQLMIDAFVKTRGNEIAFYAAKHDLPIDAAVTAARAFGDSLVRPSFSSPEDADRMLSTLTEQTGQSRARLGAFLAELSGTR